MASSGEAAITAGRLLFLVPSRHSLLIAAAALGTEEACNGAGLREHAIPLGDMSSSANL